MAVWPDFSPIGFGIPNFLEWPVGSSEESSLNILSDSLTDFSTPFAPSLPWAVPSLWSPWSSWLSPNLLWQPDSISYGAALASGFADATTFNYWDIGPYMSARLQQSMSGWRPLDQVIAEEFPSLVPGAPKSEAVQSEQEKRLAQLQDENRQLREANEKMQQAFESTRKGMG